MSFEKIDKLDKLRNEDPRAAISYLSELGSSFEEKVASAVVLVDCGSALNDVTSVSRGVEVFEQLRHDAKIDPSLSYNLANGLQVRSRLGHGPVTPVAGQAFEDRFQARVHFGSVMRNSRASAELRSQALTNIGNLLFDTFRWVEGIDCFQEAQKILPRNSVASYQEMRRSMCLASLFFKQPRKYQTYCHLDALCGRIKHLSGVVSANYDAVVEFAGEDALAKVISAVEDAAKLELVGKESIDNPYFAFIDANGLALSLHCSSEEYQSGHFDLLTIPAIQGKISDKHQVPEIYAMINVMKSDFAFARQIFFDVREHEDCTPFGETASYEDTLDYAVYGVRYSALTSAQRIAFDILDKIAVALACYLGVKSADRASFSNLWGKNGRGGIFTLNEEIASSFQSGNQGLIALYNIFHDISKDNSRGHGFMEAHKSYRNCSTHRFSVLHDEMISDDYSSSTMAVDHIHLQRFESLTFDSLKLARAALFYFVDMINFSEEARRTDWEGSVLSSVVPKHSFIRGR